MNTTDIKKITNSVLLGNFDEAVKLLPATDSLPKDISDSLFMETSFKSSFTPYAFLLYLVTKNETIELLLETCVMAHMGINYLPGAYEAAAHFARVVYKKSLPHDPEAGLTLLSLYEYPEQPLTTQEALEICEKILEFNPHNEQVPAIIQLSQKRQDAPLPKPNNTHEKLEQLIKTGFLSEAAQLAATMNEREVHQILLYIGCEEQNLCAYTLTWLLIQKKESAELHYIAYKIVTVAWAADMVGCQATGAFHLRQAMKLDTANIKYGEHFLQLHTQNPQDPNIIPDTEAEAIANKLFDLTYFSHPAERVLAKFGKIHPRFAK